MKKQEMPVQFGSADEAPQFTLFLEDDSEHSQRLAQHKAWLQSIRHERPNVSREFRVGVYIRYFNQTKHANYLEFHRKQFSDSIALCPKWTLTDFYVDEGPTAPCMETAPEWSRLLGDCMKGKVDLIITQKISNISKDIEEAVICARLLAALEKPVGIYFISEDIFTLASYYRGDLRDYFFLHPDERQKVMKENGYGGYLND